MCPGVAGFARRGRFCVCRRFHRCPARGQGESIPSRVERGFPAPVVESYPRPPTCGAGANDAAKEMVVRPSVRLADSCAKPLKNRAMTFLRQKMQVSPKKPLRGPDPNRKYPLTGGAEVPTGRQTGHTATRRKTKQRWMRPGAPKKLGRTLSILSLRSLKSLVTEEICGRFGPFDGSTTAYRLPRASAR